MQYYINSLSDFLHQLPKNLESTRNFITKTDIWLISPNISEVPLVDRSTVITGIRNIVQHGRAYIDNVSQTFEIINFIIKWPKV